MLTRRPNPALRPDREKKAEAGVALYALCANLIRSNQSRVDELAKQFSAPPQMRDLEFPITADS